MSKNYSLDYWNALYKFLEDELAQVEAMIEKYDTGEPTKITEARKGVSDYIVFIMHRLAKMQQDIEHMKFTDFNEAYID